jgi:hypothetical protein
MVSGPHGSGRTSLLMAGVVPRLLAEDSGLGGWKVAHCRGASSTMEPLARALVQVKQTALSDEEIESEVLQTTTALQSGGATRIQQTIAEVLSSWPPAGRLLVVIDDVRDIQSPIVSSWMQALRDSPVTFVAITDGPPTIPRPTKQELLAAIIGPASQVGLDLEPNLAEKLCTDVVEAPQPFPLLQFCLTRLYERGAGEQLSNTAYKRYRRRLSSDRALGRVASQQSRPGTGWRLARVEPAGRVPHPVATRGSRRVPRSLMVRRSFRSDHSRTRPS